MKSMNFVFLFMFFLLLFGCFPRHEEEVLSRQISPVDSPSGRYVLTVPIVEENRDGFESFWKVTISDKNGHRLYVDEEGFPARFNVYWNWDDEDRIWLNNSDDGAVYFWENIDGVWRKNRFVEG